MDPASFLSTVVGVISQRAHDLEAVAEELDGKDAEEIREHKESIVQTIGSSELIVSLPSILGTATTIPAINANILPEIWVLGLSPLLTFVAAAFTLALAPFIILTAYMLRVATVTLRATDTEPFVL